MINFKMETYKKIISDLKFISQLEKGDKINTKFMYRQPDGFTTRIIRTFFNHDTRQNTLKFIQETIYSTFDILLYYERSNKPSDRSTCINILSDLNKSKIGLNNLKETYSEDLKFKCDIDTILETIESKLKDIEPKYKDNISFIDETKEEIKEEIKEENKEIKEEIKDSTDNKIVKKGSITKLLNIPKIIES